MTRKNFLFPTDQQFLLLQLMFDAALKADRPFYLYPMYGMQIERASKCKLPMNYAFNTMKRLQTMKYIKHFDSIRNSRGKLVKRYVLSNRGIHLCIWQTTHRT